MKIQDTELEYSEADSTCLDFYLGDSVENKDQWAKRVWNKCSEYKATDGKGYDGKGMPEVYKKSPYFLWEQKKRRRRVSMYLELESKHLDNHLLKDEKVASDIENNIPCKWCEELSDANILALKQSGKYKTKNEREMQEEEQKKIQQQKYNIYIKENVETLRAKGFDDETIKIIYPKSNNIA